MLGFSSISETAISESTIVISNLRVTQLGFEVWRTTANASATVEIKVSITDQAKFKNFLAQGVKAKLRASSHSAPRTTILANSSSFTNMRATQVGLEAWVVNNPNLRVTQIGYEVWRSTGIANTVEGKVYISSQSKLGPVGRLGLRGEWRVSAQSKGKLRLGTGVLNAWLFTIT